MFYCFLLTALLSLLTAANVSAHEVPSDATAHMFVKPSGTRLQLLVRVPLNTIRDIPFPEFGRGYLDIDRLTPLLPDAATLWIGNFVEIYEEGARLAHPRLAATQISIESDKSFASFEEALAHVTAPKLPNSANVAASQVWFDVLFEYAIQSDRSALSIRPGLHGLAARMITVLRFLPPGGAVRAYEFRGDPGVVSLDPRWHQAALRFVRLGFLHILEGTDHLLFLLCLVVPFRRLRPLILVVTAFTAAHSITLIASAYDLGPDTLWFPPLIETLIAVSIVYMALENIIGRTAARTRWVIAFGFGLVHGFGFSFALRESLQFAGRHLLASLVSFNAGVELGQVAVLLLLVPLINALFRFVVPERMGIIILSAFVAHSGWHWTTERFGQLTQFRFEWPRFDAAWLAGAMRGLMFLLILACLVWLVWRWLGQRSAAAGTITRSEAPRLARQWSPDEPGTPSPES